MKSIYTIFLFFSYTIAFSQAFTPQTIFNDGTYDIEVVDLDEDGDLDIVAATNHWYENDGNENFTEHSLSTVSGRSTQVLDMDGDGDLDILFTSNTNDRVAWFENDGNENFTQIIISSEAPNVLYAHAADMDADGDMDVIAASFYVNDGSGGLAYSLISWFENDGNQNFTEVEIDSPNPLTSFQVVDMDEDGDLDLLTSLGWSNTIFWYENDATQSFPQHSIHFSSPGSVSDLYAVDMDGDGDMDVLSASTSGGDKDIAWHENDGSQNFTKINLLSYSGFLTKIYATDLDEDGDLDIFSSHSSSNKFQWHQNNGNQEFVSYTIAPTTGANDYVPVDIDGDGDTDVIAANNDNLTWYERPNFVDEDWDGYPIDEDCDDTNAQVNPAASEILNNGVDDNCDGINLVLEAQGAEWCKLGTYADDGEADTPNGAVLTSDSLLFVGSQFDDIKIYNWDNNLIGGWAINGAPISLTVDSEENIYVGINGGLSANLVEKYDKQGNLLETYDSFGEANTVYVDDNFNVYVVNQPVDKVQIFNPTGTMIDSWDYTFDGGPTLLTADDEGFFYVGSLNVIQKFNGDGTVVGGWELEIPPGQSTFGDRYGIEFNEVDGLLYLLRSPGGAADRVYVYTTDGAYLYDFPSQTSWGTSLSFSPYQHLIIGDWSADNVEIFQRDSIYIDFEITQISCDGDANGALNYEIYGGCTPVEFTLNPPSDFDQLTVGDYELTMTFVDGQTSIYDFNIAAADPILIDFTTQDASMGANDGAINLTVSGGVGDLSYLWNTAATTPNLDNLAPGDYWVIVTDANDCTNEAFFTIGGFGLDMDNDGFFANEDCDDDNAAINPDAAEIPNNDVDEDCDGVALIIDNDNDGFNSDEDCDDENGAINPDAVEIPNNDIDEDCDGVALIIDNDNDGFNSDEDCDDENAAINPDATEIPNNGIDEDCDGMDLINSTHELDGQAVHVFPNPVHDQLTIEMMGSVANNLAIRIFSIDGKLLLEKPMNMNLQTIDLSLFANGLYLLEISNVASGARILEKIEKVE